MGLVGFECPLRGEKKLLLEQENLDWLLLKSIYTWSPASALNLKMWILKMRVLQAIFFFNFWNFTFQNEKVDREPKNMPFIRQLPLKSIFWPLPRYLFLRTFSKLLIVFSTKVNLLYLLYSMSQRSCHLLHYRLPCSCFILFPLVHTSLFMFHLSSVSPHFIDHVSFLFSSVHSPSHSFHLPQSISFIFTLFGCTLHGYSTILSFSLFSQSHLWKLMTY